MTQGLHLVFTVLVWWAGTGVTLALCALPPRTFRWSLAGGAAVAALSLAGLAESADGTSSGAAYCAFLSAIGVWSFLEMLFLMGLVTGPRRLPCPPGASGWGRFRLAVATLLWHELSILAACAIVASLTWGHANQTGLAAFGILAVMRISAKLNIFLGVPNLTDSLLPARLAYLKTYFRRRAFNPLLPVSVLGASAVVLWLVERASGLPEGAADGAAAATALLGVLLSLAILEHLFMLLPVRDAALWLWAVPANGRKSVREASQ